MSKTAPIPDDIHALIIDKQTELKRKHKITVKISDLIAMYVRYGVKKTEKLLGLKSDEESEVVNEEKQEIINNSEKPKVDMNIIDSVETGEEGGKS